METLTLSFSVTFFFKILIKPELFIFNYYCLGIESIEAMDFNEYGPDYGHYFPEVWFDGPEIEGFVKQIEISFKWRDQGWENRKGKIWLQVIRAGKTVLETSNQLCGIAPHRWNEARIQLTRQDEVVRRFKPGDSYRFMRDIGGGGHHSLHVQNFKALLHVVNYE